jgi:hypothetical protein
MSQRSHHRRKRRPNQSHNHAAARADALIRSLGYDPSEWEIVSVIFAIPDWHSVEDHLLRVCAAHGVTVTRNGNALQWQLPDHWSPEQIAHFEADLSGGEGVGP